MTKKDLSLICNYSEKNIDISCALFNYLSFEYSEDIKLIQKKINRNNILNKILDEENNEYDLYEPHIEYSTDNIPSINIKIYSIKVNSFIYNKIENIYTHTLKELENITSSNIVKIPAYKILNRISLLQNLINIKSRINKANRIICGLNAYSELIKTDKGSFNEDGIYNIYKMDVIYSDLISTNKFIVARFGNNIESGLNLILSESTNSFYIFKTHCWENNISWFEI